MTEFRFGACFVSVSIDRTWGPRVQVNAGATMTPDEARQLAAAIVEAADEIEAETAPPS